MNGAINQAIQDDSYDLFVRAMLLKMMNCSVNGAADEYDVSLVQTNVLELLSEGMAIDS